MAKTLSGLRRWVQKRQRRRTAIQRSRRVAPSVKAAYNDKRRPFFGVNASDEAAIVAKITAHVADVLKKL